MPRTNPNKRVLRITCGVDACTVTPGVLLVPPGKTISIVKPAGATVYIQVSGMQRTFNLPKGLTRIRVTIPKRMRLGIYPYAVFCYEQKKYCTGSSMPIIIVPRSLER